MIGGLAGGGVFAEGFEGEGEVGGEGRFDEEGLTGYGMGEGEGGAVEGEAGDEGALFAGAAVVAFEGA